MKGKYKENYTEEYHKKTAKTKNKDKNLKEKGEVGKAYYLLKSNNKTDS